MQQRSVSPLVMHGGTIRYLTKKSRREIEREVGSRIYKRLSDQLNAYLIEIDGMIIIAGHRIERVRRV
jgi:hypothetical protein